MRLEGYKDILSWFSTCLVVVGFGLALLIGLGYPKASAVLGIRFWGTVTEVDLKSAKLRTADYRFYKMGHYHVRDTWLTPFVTIGNEQFSGLSNTWEVVRVEGVAGYVKNQDAEIEKALTLSREFQLTMDTQKDASGKWSRVDRDRILDFVKAFRELDTKRMNTIIDKKMDAVAGAVKK